MPTTKEAMEALSLFQEDPVLDAESAAAVSTLRQFIEEAGRDAERYREWRDEYVGNTDELALLMLELADAWTPEAVDAAIDAALAARASKPGQEG